MSRTSDRQAEAIVCGKCRLLRGWVTRRWRLHVLYFVWYQAFFPGVVHRISTVLQLPTEIGGRFGFLLIVVIEKRESVGSAVDPLHDVYVMLQLWWAPVVQFSLFFQAGKLCCGGFLNLTDQVFFFSSCLTLRGHEAGFHAYILYWFPVVFVWPLKQNFSILFDLFERVIAFYSGLITFI